MVGPHCEKSKDIVAALLADGAVIQTMTVCEDIDLIIKNNKISEMQTNCQRFMERNCGTANKIFDEVFITQNSLP